MAGDDAVAGDDLLGHAEVAAAVGDELVDLLEACRDRTAGRCARARRELAGRVLPIQTILAAAELGTALEVCEDVVRRFIVMVSAVSRSAISR